MKAGAGAAPGRCRFCGCTREQPCALSNGDECAFLNARANRCSRPECVKAFEDERDRMLCEDKQRRAMVRQLREQHARQRNRKGRIA